MTCNNVSYEQALKLLGSFEIKPGDDWDRHCINVGEIAYRLAVEIGRHSGIDADKTRVMGLVHDFGRCVTHDPYRHAYEGYRLMKRIGWDELARICVCHSNGTFKHEDLDEYGLKPEDFYVRTVPEMLVFIGDSIECHGKMIRHDVRIAETIERYRLKNPEFIPVLESKLAEFREFDNRIRNIIGMGVYEFFNI